MNNEVPAKPTRYNIYQQDLTSSVLELKFMGYVKTFSEAKNMCQILHEAEVRNGTLGKHAYFFRCEEFEGGNVNEQARAD